MINKNTFFAKLDAIGSEKVKDMVTQHTFPKKELPLVQEWLRSVPKRDSKIYVFHILRQPEYEHVSFSDAIDYFQKGWTDGLGTFPPGLRGIRYKIVLYFRPKRLKLKKFWINHWKWIISTAVALFALYCSLTK